MYGTTEYQRTYFHCAEHAEEFHLEVNHLYLCCGPPYVPHVEYPWQKEGRAIDMLKNKKPSFKSLYWDRGLSSSSQQSNPPNDPPAE